ANTGTHVGLLYANGGGTALGSANFSGEGASGWQLVNFTTGVSISANTTYVAAVYMPVGHYSDDQSGTDTHSYSSAHTNGNITGLQDTTSAHNGVYTYGTGANFP